MWRSTNLMFVSVACVLFVIVHCCIAQTITAIPAPSGTAGDAFGRSVAYSADGNFAAIGSFAGGVFTAQTFTRSASNSWSLEHTFTQGSSSDGFGAFIALSKDTLTIAISCSQCDSKGAVFVYTRPSTSGSWSLQQKVVASDGAVDDLFGFGTIMDDDASILIVGAVGSDAAGTDSGAVYVYSRSGATWGSETKYTPSGLAAGDTFGIAIAISADKSTVTIGAAGATVGSFVSHGVAYICTLSGTTLTFQYKVIIPDGVDGARFPRSVALSKDGNTAVFGCTLCTTAGLTTAGAVYVYTRSGTTWSPSQRFNPNPVEDGRCGRSVQISEAADVLMFSCFFESFGGLTNAGAAYVYDHSGSVYTFRKRLTAINPTTSGNFGTRTDLSSDGYTAIFGHVGAYSTIGEALVFDFATLTTPSAGVVWRMYEQGTVTWAGFLSNVKIEITDSSAQKLTFDNLPASGSKLFYLSRLLPGPLEVSVCNTAGTRCLRRAVSLKLQLS